ncbi:hypothetical protein HMPREF9134_01512 [Porphyromonas catoniae F0037]|jgi:hypothetical protein|uniref:Uncharacterized protein n=1 Tax=Porphyromonas catoniae F0037 TaxID=1127696 RepID=L1NAE4_9PORP|nr:hypothetical protein HMPREF9134_01512 [Porphyromonas catoniae F0037]
MIPCLPKGSRGSFYPFQTYPYLMFRAVSWEIILIFATPIVRLGI